MDQMVNQDILRLAKMNVRLKPQVNVLDSNKIDQYSFLIKSIDSVLKDKLKRKTLVLPELTKNGNQTIAVYSDYGGETKESKYYTYSFLFCGHNHSFGFPDEIRKLRIKHKLNNTEIAFKSFHYGPMIRLLPEYLNTLNFLVVGLLVTIVVDKQIPSFFTSQKQLSELSELLEKEQLGSWKPAVAEKLIRIVHIIAYFIGLLSTDGQKIFWMTDNDGIAPNPEKHKLSLELLQRVLPLYTKNKFSLFGGATPFENDNVGYYDFLSSTDITAGSVEQYFTRKYNAKDNDILVKDGADKVLNWLAHDGIGLKKVNIIIEKQQDGLLASETVFSEIEEDKNAIKILIPIQY
jgi:hypothetical protein